MRQRSVRAAGAEADGTEAASDVAVTSEAPEATSAAAPEPTTESQASIVGRKLEAGGRQIAEQMGIPFPALIAILIGKSRNRSLSGLALNSQLQVLTYVC